MVLESILTNVQCLKDLFSRYNDALFLMTCLKVNFFLEMFLSTYQLPVCPCPQSSTTAVHWGHTTHHFLLSYLFDVLIILTISTTDSLVTGMLDCYTGVRTHFSIIGRNIENVKITDNWKNTFTKRLLTFLTVEKCGKLLLKFVKNSFTSTNLKRLIMLKWLNCIIECLHFMTISWIQMNLEGSQSISGKIIYELFLA